MQNRMIKSEIFDMADKLDQMFKLLQSQQLSINEINAKLESASSQKDKDEDGQSSGSSSNDSDSKKESSLDESGGEEARRIKKRLNPFYQNQFKHRHRPKDSNLTVIQSGKDFNQEFHALNRTKSLTTSAQKKEE